MKEIAILMYHSIDASGSVVSVSPQEFASQMGVLADLGLRAMRLREAVRCYIENGCWPERAVVLTFDDGFANFFDTAFPVLERHGFTATMFVVSRHVGGLNDWAPPPAGLGARALMDWNQLAELATAGVEIGSHTLTHPDLRRLPAREAANEIKSSRAEIEDRLGQPVESFAYPFGAVSRDCEEIIKREYRAACTTTLRRAKDDPLYSLPRVDMYYIRSRRSLERLVNGDLDGYLSVRRWARAARALAPLQNG
ncbi:MAG TPA: polysaccharide deacetylase family protein [Blastocatellia bacterium]|nr:polysaccharide deacetylase family protein [Blastocatellia bacterium]